MLLLSYMSEEESMIAAAEIYEKLHCAYGQPRWWSDNPYIVMVQSILVQNTSWSLVERSQMQFQTR